MVESHAIVASLQTVATDALGVLADVAPVAISIAGAFMVWKFGMRFFKTISNKG